MGLPVCKLVYLPFVVWCTDLDGAFIMVVHWSRCCPNVMCHYAMHCKLLWRYAVIEFHEIVHNCVHSCLDPPGWNPFHLNQFKNYSSYEATHFILRSKFILAKAQIS